MGILVKRICLFLIGPLYYYGIINNATIRLTNAAGSKVPLYQLHDEIITESNRNFDAAAAVLGSIGSPADFAAVLIQLIPSFTQMGHGGVLTPQMWIHNINTMKAKNILVNRRTKTITGADWTDLLALADRHC